MLREFLKDEQGQDVVEYSLLLVLIGAAAVFVLTTMGHSISSIFHNINSKLNAANLLQEADRPDLTLNYFIFAALLVIAAVLSVIVVRRRTSEKDDDWDA